MKKIAVVVLCLCFLALSRPQGVNYGVDANEYAPEAISIALYNGSGACCIESMKSMFEWMNFSVTLVDAEDIMNGNLDDFDVLAWPGGDYCSYWQVGQQGKVNIQNFVRDGGGYYGTCAGAWWAGDYMIWKADPAFPPPDYKVEGNESNLDIFPGVARGPMEQINLFYSYGTPIINIVNHDHPITSGMPDQIQIMYVGGCELLPYEGANVTVLGTYDVTGTPAIVAFEYGNGRVYLTGPHPEFMPFPPPDGYFTQPDSQVILLDPESEWPLILNAMEWLAQRPMPVMTISCGASPSTITAGNTINITGSIGPAQPGVNVTLLYTRPSASMLTNPIRTDRTYLELFPLVWYDFDTPPSVSMPNPDGITWTVYAQPNITTVTRSAITDSKGAYTDLYAPDTNGTWIVHASWSLDDHHIAASRNVEFEVKLNATLTIQSSNASLVPGTNVTIYGTLSPAQAGNVTIYRSVNSNAFVSIGDATLLNGQYIFPSPLNDAGTYQVYAYWPGNENYNEATSGTVTVTAATPIDPLWYVVIGGVAVVAIAAAVYFLRRR